MKSNLSAVLQQTVGVTGGVMTFDGASHSCYAATAPAMYGYLPMPARAAANVTMRGANIVYVYRTRTVYDDVVRWWFLCALERRCIAPKHGSELQCRFHSGGNDGGETGEHIDRSRSEWAGCHRFDQSALNILLANRFAFDDRKYFAPPGVVEVRRVRLYSWLCRVRYALSMISAC